ncbi:unnamed protein product [Clonostachys rosea f. rosea IK726]|uniref:Uncharacterized protein n=1 Tax=Clonostachys rosea f. rosea IK726 TaxID=1349383 RepID=A0ACA9TL28_BIOOC|nr:unnamed protein product [Clonostachys rosea f. rosea IK726]
MYKYWGYVQDRLFKNHIVHMHGSSTDYTPACLKRDFAPQLCVDKLNQAVVDRTMEASKSYEFDRRVQGAIGIEGLTYHGGGHVGIGAELGDISDIYSHHANMDRIWDKWQRKAWSCRKKDIGGPDIGFAYPYNFFGANPPYKNVTLQYKMEFHGLVPGESFVKFKRLWIPVGTSFAMPTNNQGGFFPFFHLV